MRLGVAAALGLAAAAQLGAAAPPPPPASRGPGLSGAASGAVLYEAHCASCHGLRGTGTGEAPPLVGVGAAAVDFMLSTGRMPIADPRQPTLRQRPRFSRAEADALITYVGSFGPGGPRVPTVHPDRGNLARGERIFADHCAACHGADGQGAAVAEGQVAPSLHEATPVQIAEAVRVGPGPMPRFDDKVIDAADLDSLVRYVRFLQTAPDPGGADLGHEGPVIEGFVAWLLGLGLMLAAARLIGTTT